MKLKRWIKDFFTKKSKPKLDYHKEYWFPNGSDGAKAFNRKIKIDKIYKLNRNITHTHWNITGSKHKRLYSVPVGDTALDKGFKSAIGKYSIAFGSSNTVTSGYNNTAYGSSVFPDTINKIRIKKLTKIYRKDS